MRRKSAAVSPFTSDGETIIRKQACSFTGQADPVFGVFPDMFRYGTLHDPDAAKKQAYSMEEPQCRNGLAFFPEVWYTVNKAKAFEKHEMKGWDDLCCFCMNLNVSKQRRF